MEVRCKQENPAIRRKNKLKKRKNIKKRKISSGLPVFQAEYPCFYLLLCTTLPPRFYKRRQYEDENGV
jgi:hypothetical protein